MRKISFAPLLLSVIVLLSGCEYQETWQKTVRKAYGEVIDFDWNKQFVFNDTVLQNNDCLRIPIKIVTVIEDDLCDVVDKEGPFEKYLYVRMKGRDEFQTIVIKGTAVLN